MPRRHRSLAVIVPLHLPLLSHVAPLLPLPLSFLLPAVASAQYLGILHKQSTDRAARRMPTGAALPGHGRDTGAGDPAGDVFFIAADPARRGWIWGLGPALSFDSASSPIPGSGRYAAGPALAVVRQPGPWTYGAMASQSWSFWGSDDHPRMNSVRLQPIASYRLSPRHTIGYGGIITADWDRRSGQRWTVPLGLTWSTLSRPRDAIPINTSVGIGYNVLRPDQAGTWFVRFQINVILPKR